MMGVGLISGIGVTSLLSGICNGFLVYWSVLGGSLLLNCPQGGVVAVGGFNVDFGGRYSPF